jgi:ABC-type transporter Mla subunit MlaD
MKIYKFNESNILDDISPDRIDEVLNKLTETSNILDDKMESIQSLIGEFSKFKSNSKKSNDQIDDTVLSLESLKSKMSDSLQIISSINENLENYKENGRKYIY